jgi:anti-anti-sigma regulatory factor/anti-sigma regulatory factor (Ser/Thr protein kinase)
MDGDELRSEIERAADLATIRLHGPIRAATAPALRTAVHKCLTDEPAAVVIDMSGVNEVDDLGLLIFPALARAVAAWPGAQLVLMHVPDRTIARMRAIATAHLLTFVDSDEEVRALIAQDESPPMLREDLPSGPAAVTLARALVRRICAVGPIASLADDAELVVSELVSNATVHARPPVALTVTRRPAYLHIAVRDASTAEPQIGGRDDTLLLDGDLRSRDGGRGLLVVEALCVAWGCTPTADGKVVWATMRHSPRLPWTAVPAEA